MHIFPVKAIIDGLPSFKIPFMEIMKLCVRGGALVVLSRREYREKLRAKRTAAQVRWYKGIACRGLSQWNGETLKEWDYRLKDECGQGLLNEQEIYLGYGKSVIRLTTDGVSVKNMTLYIENIISKAITEGWPLSPPDPELRKL